MNEKVIMHYDMDAFFASVEIRDNEQLKGIPLVVGENVVTTASYEARKFGVHSAMSVWEAKKLCPNLKVIPVNKKKYIETSLIIQELIKKITKKVEFISLDEGYIDLTDIIKNYRSKLYFGEKFKERLYRHTKLTCSVGIGYNKLSAKIASDVNKPSGICIFENRESFLSYLYQKDINILPGIGKKTFPKIVGLGIKRVEDLKRFSLFELVSHLGKSRGELLYYYGRGEDFRKVASDQKIHSIGNEKTYRFSPEGMDTLKKELEEIMEKVYSRLLKKRVYCKTVTIKVKNSQGVSQTRSITFKEYTKDRLEIIKRGRDLLNEFDLEGSSVRLLGFSLGNIVTKDSIQLKLPKYKLFHKGNKFK